MGILQAGTLEGVAMPSSRDLSNPGIEPMSPAWQQSLYPLSHQGSPPGYTTVYLSIHLLKDILVASKSGQLYIKSLIDVQCYLIVIVISSSLR